MYRTLFATLLFSALAASAGEAQIYTFHFRDEKAMRPYGKYVFDRDGQNVLAGEVLTGVTFRDNNISWPSSESHKIRIVLLDPSSPVPAPYKLVGGQKAGMAGSRLAELTGKDVGSIKVLTRDYDLFTLAKAFEEKLAELDDLQSGLKEYRRGTDQMERAEKRLELRKARLIRWMSELGFGDRAVKNVDKKLRKVDAPKEIVKKAEKIEVPEGLDALGKELLGESDLFAIMESPHCRITFSKQVIDEDRVKALLEFGEQVIATVRADFILAYDDESYEDWIPDECFQEIYFGPDDVKAYEQIYERFYRMSWGPQKEQMLKGKGTGVIRRKKGDIPYFSYWRAEDLDFEQIMAHRLGHSLADLHFNKWRRRESLSWLSEGFGYYLTLINLGRSTTFCRAMRTDRYAGEEKSGGGAAYGGEDAIHQMALERDTPIDTLSGKDLSQMDEGDVAKGTSFFIYLMDNEGLAGQKFLRSGCEHASSTDKDWLEQWRKDTREIFGLPEGGDPLRVLDERWEEWAKAKLKTD
ncbi:MAG: hypothetical protein RL885_31375 [Planctomycetota bacterium]